MRTMLLSAALIAPLAGFSMPLWAQEEAPPVRETPSDVIAAATAEDWRPIEPENLLVMTLAEGAEVYIELAPEFAPVHVENIRRLARAHWYDGISVNRVQDNYVVQWGDPAEEEAERKPLPEDVVMQPPAEYEFETRGLELLDFTPVQQGHYTLQSGYLNGWPLGADQRLEVAHRGVNRVTVEPTTPGPHFASLVHCYGMVGVGRGNNPDTGTGAELYTVIGHAPRHLDRNIALVGRVIEGIENLSSLPRGTGPLGFYEDPTQRVPIDSVRLASELPEAERPRFEVMRTDGDIFRRYVEARANRMGWFIRPAGAVDVCNVNLPIRRVVAED
ncbi:peptidylprolyl isomerase [uncultured Parasphingopyxis sp.]|uniref:peptidylprolyl isomerase n=1 Tax=uncultured Parasphingopyxis sp. TaxID=1547918 RepID=UPI002638778F|nr:peptidylprolyl isomerase [uncultured Parasphingopyxis sp.]